MGKLTNWIGTGLRLLLVVSMFSGLALKPALSAPELKAGVPKMDVEHTEPKKPVVPLQGKIQHSAKRYTIPGMIQNRNANLKGWGRGTMAKDTLKGQANQLESEVESGIGIIGVKFSLFPGKNPEVNRVFPMTPAFKVGIQDGDVIIAVDGVPTLGLAKEEVYDMIVGTPGTSVTLSIRRSGDFRAITMTRMDLNDITDANVRRDYMMSM